VEHGGDVVEAVGGAGDHRNARQPLAVAVDDGLDPARLVGDEDLRH